MNDRIDESFLRTLEPLRPGLRLHCYRMLGSASDGDDVMQEVLLRAWRAKDSLADSSALRPWLYRIATNACLDELKDRRGRPLPMDVVEAATDPLLPPAPPNPEVTWLEPCPDSWLVNAAPDPGAAYELRESVALAFVAALQCLSARERGVLLLRDVVGMSAEETASALDMSVPAANSTLHRARTAVRERAGEGNEAGVVDVTSDLDEELLRKYVHAWETLDLAALVALLHDDITISMPPSPTWFSGKDTVTRFLANRPFVLLAKTSMRIEVVRANGQPALAFYVGGVLHSVHVVRLKEGRVFEVHHFGEGRALAAFGLPHTDGALTVDADRRRARAACDTSEGRVLATVEVHAPPGRVFRALASEEIVHWWVRPGVFDTTEWTGDVRPGGQWRVGGNARGRRYVLEGQFTEIDAPRKLVHTWHPFEGAAKPTTVTYVLEAVGEWTRITLRQERFTVPDACINTGIGWETSFARLAEYLADGA